MTALPESPTQRYRAALAAHSYSTDPAQERAIARLDRVWRELIERGNPGLLQRLKTKLNGAPVERAPVRGLYLWGGVGRGKTFLMDIFFHALPFEQKLRLHFHRFMRQVHAELKTLPDVEDPLRTVAARLATRTRVICFDEFFVSDIADAMILGRLFEHLFRFGVTLVTTSNIPPDELYKDGLQRVRFLPAVAQIQNHCAVLNVDARTDYRLRMLETVEIYHWPAGDSTNARMEDYFKELNPEEAPTNVTNKSIVINDRTVPARRIGESVSWFDFSSLCQGARSTADYIVIAQEFHTVLLSNVPVLDTGMENEAARFINLVDEFYDHSVKLIISADAPVDGLYVGTRLQFEFQRTMSRLVEMQSKEYLSLPHRP